MIESNSISEKNVFEFNRIGVGLIEKMLTFLLALYVIIHSRKPISEVIEKLLAIEISAAKIVGSYFDQNLHTTQEPVVYGFLARVFSFIPVNPRRGFVERSPLKSFPISATVLIQKEDQDKSLSS